MAGHLSVPQGGPRIYIGGNNDSKTKHGKVRPGLINYVDVLPEFHEERGRVVRRKDCSQAWASSARRWDSALETFERVQQTQADVPEVSQSPGRKSTACPLLYLAYAGCSLGPGSFPSCPHGILRTYPPRAGPGLATQILNCEPYPPPAA